MTGGGDANRVLRIVLGVVLSVAGVLAIAAAWKGGDLANALVPSPSSVVGIVFAVSGIFLASGKAPREMSALAAGSAIVVTIGEADHLAPRNRFIYGDSAWTYVALAATVVGLVAGVISLATVRRARAATPAGWYADPAGSGSRYWDGSNWTVGTRN